MTQVKTFTMPNIMILAAFLTNTIAVPPTAKFWVYFIIAPDYFWANNGFFYAFTAAAHLSFLFATWPFVYERFGKPAISGIKQAKTVTALEIRAIRRRHRAIQLVSRLHISEGRTGFIYIMRRSDGIYKIGYTDDTRRRLSQHRHSYKTKFELVRRFVVADKVEFERLALMLTKKYSYEESRRLELRKMTDSELANFLAEFQDICIAGLCL